MDFTQFLIGFITGGLFGAVFGYLLGKKTLTIITLKGFIAVIVILTWTIAMIISFIKPEYEVSAYLHGAFGGILSALWSEEYFDKIMDKNKGN